jgi:CheY-like chemotaxis protein
MIAPSPLNFPDLRGLTLLVVDDNEDAVEVLSMFLEICGAAVLVARTAMGGLTYVAEVIRPIEGNSGPSGAVCLVEGP